MGQSQNTEENIEVRDQQIFVLNEKTYEIFEIQYDSCISKSETVHVDYEKGKYLPNLKIFGSTTLSLIERTDGILGYIDSNSNLYRYLPLKFFGNFYDGKSLVQISSRKMDFMFDRHTEEIVWKCTDSKDTFHISSNNLEKKKELLFTWTSLDGREGWLRKDEEDNETFYLKAPDSLFGTFELESGIWFSIEVDNFYFDGKYSPSITWNATGFFNDDSGEFIWRTDGVEGYIFLKKDSTERILSKKIFNFQKFQDKRTIVEKIKDNTGITFAMNIYNNGIRWMK
jgi:hypothetical protein